MKQVMTIAGSDSGGGAGIQADLKVFAAMGLFGTSVITAVTAQNTREVTHVHEIPVESIRAQIRALFADFEIAAVKTGMLPSEDIVRAVAEELESEDRPYLVVDPVMVSASRHELMRAGAAAALRDALFPLATVVTPNLFEASVLVGGEVATLADMREAAESLRALGPTWVLIKGGHGEGDEAVDVLYDGVSFRELRAPRVENRNSHGTGCTFASAVAARLALGESVPEAARRAKTYVTETIRHGLDVGSGSGPTHPLYFASPWEKPRS